mmetsp:Transcript_9716/g.34500  ORF Transcript_9716/g.34500 Transcript_9716/m.34500 type:complete len:177 (+) Transcript_9716:73-603(+)
MATLMRFLSRAAPAATESVAMRTPKTPAVSPAASPTATTPASRRFGTAEASPMAFGPLPVLLGRTRQQAFGQQPFGLPVSEGADAMPSGPLPVLLGRTRRPEVAAEQSRRPPRLLEQAFSGPAPVLLGRTGFRPPARQEAAVADASASPASMARRARDVTLERRVHLLERRCPLEI